MSSIHPDLPNLFEFDSPIAPAALSGPGVGVHVTEDVFGRMGSVPIQRFTLGNAKVTVQVISLGAIITAIRMPDKDGKEEDVVLGYDSPDGYLSADNPYFGATVGRVANRIANASFTLDGKEYKLHANAGQNTLHGGLRGWDKAVWNASRHVDGVTFSLLSPDGDEGFPGAVLAQVTYRLTVDSRLMISMQAIATKPTPVNIVNHAYFNLAGHGAGPQEVYKTRLAVNGDRYTVLDQFQIPTGAFAHVEGTPLDFRTPRLLGDVLPKFDVDHNFVITRGLERPAEMVYVAGAVHEPSGRTLELYTDQPGIQVYTSNGLPDASQGPMIGKAGAKYIKHGAFCLETQNFPDAIHNDRRPSHELLFYPTQERRFPNSVLRPGSLYKHNMVFKFGVRMQPKTQ
ncbi:galactose mutarotase isoform X2 [Frankliniella occidentalis]|uniref:Aldose 1-epimerase n=1 Tax=Frankliniella occidentalis TaxID=133901 RepID=A0A6J1SQE0_FRAOC|nr:galactose mutarotase isoform X2 [Frankliniella occidentalis]